MMPASPNTDILMVTRQSSRAAPLIAAACAACAAVTVAPAVVAASPFATDLVSHTGFPSTPGTYTDPSAVLGKPTTLFRGDAFDDGTYRASLVSAPYERDPAGRPVVTTIGAGQQIVVGFAQEVRNDPGNPFGIDLLVFGNSFFPASTPVSPTSDMRDLTIRGGANAEPVTVSVAQQPTGPWYTFAAPATGDGLFPTNAYRWDAAAGTWGGESDFSRPVNPALTDASFNGLSAADAIGLYAGSGGGAGFDLALTGFEWIRYVRLTGDGGEVDALADVSPVPEPSAAAATGAIAVGLLARRRARRGPV